MTGASRGQAQRPVNPIVAKAAAQVREAKARRRKLPDVPQWDCAGQLTLFVAEGESR
ncbi:hypothetical protein [Nocardia mexicana]|uniref:Uncharacterized protein n=1 Tax=Nocardia mexicana TaxID=279262 RepID=A0A370H371_9NOCA|nr:hypothetical protein [Nocardia mexicana]RDI48533.1 hypothetical protein DFR68_108366 [Nocardia mexicana]